MNPRVKKPSIWFHVCGILVWVRDAAVEHPRTVWTVLGFCLSIGGIGGYTVSEVTTDPLRQPTAPQQDSINKAMTDGINDLKAFMSDGFNQMGSRQDNIEMILSLVAKQVGTDKEIRRERQRRARQDSIRKELFPYGDNPTDLSRWPAFADHTDGAGGGALQ